MTIQILPLVKVAIAFVTILVAIRKKFSLGNSFLMGAIILGILFGLDTLQILKSIMASVTDPKTVSLAVIVGLILILSNSMERGGQMQRLLDSYRGLISNSKLNLTLFPALIGLLPMPGGAVFSAPMVKILGDHSNLSGAQLCFVNYWFRHIWEYWWPMYPGVLLTAVLTDINLAFFVIAMFPLTIAAVSFGRQPIKQLKVAQKIVGRSRRPSARPFLKELIPILIVIVPGLSAGMLITAAFPSFSGAKETGLIVCLCGAIVWVWYQNRFKGDWIRTIMLDPDLLNMFYMVAAILIFKGILSDSRAVNAVSDTLIAMNIPLLMITAFLPFIVGFIGGISIAFVGSTFPILIPMIHAMGESQFMLPYIMVAMVCGFAGVLFSPLHACLILSNAYFQTSLQDVYRYMWFPCVGLILSALVYYWLLHWGLTWVL